EQHDKESDSAAEHSPIPESRLVAALGRRREIACEADNHDDKALEPHTGVHDQRHDEKKRDTVAQFVSPKKLQQKNIAKNQSEIKVRVGAVEPLLHKKDVKLVSAVEGHEKLEEVAVGDDEAGGEHDFGHVVEVPHSDEVFQAVGFAERDGDGQHHRETGINGP